MTIVTPSKWLANLVKQSFLREYPVEVINNGIDLDIFKPTESGFREIKGINNKFIILGVANVWEEKKGIRYFYKLSSMLEKDEAIVLVGLTEKQKSELPKNIIGITRTNNTKELAEIYTMADVFVNPTLEEVLGLTNIEALACGTPVITFNTGGSIECIDENTGYIVEKGNIDKLREEISKIKDKKISSDDCIRRAEVFDKDKKFNEYIDLYKERFEK